MKSFYIDPMSRKHLSEPWFGYIRDGLKSVEGRLKRGFWSTCREGDFIIFYNDQEETVKVRIDRITSYDSFAEYLQAEGLGRCLPGIETLEQGVEIYREIYPDQSDEVLALEISLVK